MSFNYCVDFCGGCDDQEWLIIVDTKQHRNTRGEGGYFGGVGAGQTCPVGKWSEVLHFLLYAIMN